MAACLSEIARLHAGVVHGMSCCVVTSLLRGLGLVPVGNRDHQLHLLVVLNGCCAEMHSIGCFL
jgi:hypothetical protein